MRSRAFRAISAFLSTAVLGACIAGKSTTPTDADRSPQLLVQANFRPTAEKRPVGWIYAYGDVRGRKNACVYIWSDSTWSFAEETSPGYFGDEIARGCVGVADRQSMLPALDFPRDGLDGWSSVYVAGDLEARYKGTALRSKS